MSDTFTQIHIQYVFAVKKRQALIKDVWRPRLHQYISGITRECGHKLLQINSIPDHIHLLVGMRPFQSISDFMQKVKSLSTGWINKEGLCRTDFAWQGGYGAFSYAKKEVPNVITYIQNQQQHHKKESFLDEYRRLLHEFEIAYEEKYIFHEPN